MTPSRFPDRPFQDRVAVLATKHRKETAIAPLLEPTLGVRLQVPPDFDSDAFGTFTRDVARRGTQLDAARAKADAALDATGESLALASEGAFSPHPALPFVTQNVEILVLRDRRHRLELIGRAATTETNFAQTQVRDLDAAWAFAKQIGFPEHGLVVADCDPSDLPSSTEDAAIAAHLIKGIVSGDRLEAAVREAIARCGQAHLETDMRAMVNPTRMQAIAAATRHLIEQVNRRCPKCNTPGFNVVERRPGLPCAACHLPTFLAKAAIARCSACGHERETPFPDGRRTADPGSCQFCNP